MGVEWDPGLTCPGNFPGEDLRHGPAGVVFRLHAAVQGGQDGFQVLWRVLLVQGNEILDLHAGLCDGAGFVHTQHIHPGQRLNAVHVLDQDLLLGQLHGGHSHGHTGQQI